MDLRFCATNVAHIFLTPGNPLLLVCHLGPAPLKVRKGVIALKGMREGSSR